MSAAGTHNGSLLCHKCLLIALHVCCCSVALPDPAHPLVLLALDCEMCATVDSDKALLQVAVVDQDGRQLMKVSGQRLIKSNMDSTITYLHCCGIIIFVRCLLEHQGKLVTVGQHCDAQLCKLPFEFQWLKAFSW
jgi:hypothetical protein